MSLSNNVAPALAVYGHFAMNNCNVYGTTRSSLETSPNYHVYDMCLVNDSYTTAKDSKIGTIIAWPKAQLTLINTEVDTIYPQYKTMNTNAKYGIVVGEGSTVDVIDLSIIENPERVNITVKDGGKINSFVDNGVSYATLEDWRAAQ